MADGMNEVGLYSISVRDMDVPDLLARAAGNDISFLHLGGGPRGVDLAPKRRSG